MKNINEISITRLKDYLQNKVFTHYVEQTNPLKNLHITRYFQETITEIVLNDPKVQRLLSSNSKFDLVIIESLYPILYAFGHHFTAPVIGKDYFYKFVVTLKTKY